MRQFTFGLVVALVMLAAVSVARCDPPAAVPTQVTDEQVRQAIDKGIAYLRSKQSDDGSWHARPTLGVTALVTTAMLDRPDISADDPAVDKAVKYMLTKVQPDGGIHEGMLQTYTTAVCLSAFSRLGNKPEMQPIIKNAQKYLVSLQWGGPQSPEGQMVDSSNAYYGGVGYGPGSRPDLSNTAMMLEALTDSGMDCHDPAFVRAIAFVSNLQAVEGNKHLEGKADMDGGFVYVQQRSGGRGRRTGGDGENRRPPAPDNDAAKSQERPQQPQRPAAEQSERAAERMSSYGSMTYAGYMSYAYAQLDPKDPRVVAASKWISGHYTMDNNPGMPAAAGKAGLFYYYFMLSRAMHAWNTPTVTTPDGDKHNWKDDLAAKLVSLQRDDGSWVNTDSPQWGENDPTLVTAYAIIALTQAGR